MTTRKLGPKKAGRETRYPRGLTESKRPPLESPEESPVQSPARTPIAPPHLVSRHAMRVRFFETDLMGIVHHATYLTYFEAGRVDWLHKRGVAYDAWTKAGVHLPVVETQLRYRKPAKFDDRLVVVTAPAQVTRVTVRFDYEVLREADEPGGQETLLCEGHTLLACVGHDLAPKRLPQWVVDTFASAEHPESAWK